MLASICQEFGFRALVDGLSCPGSAHNEQAARFCFDHCPFVIQHLCYVDGPVVVTTVMLATGWSS